MLFQFLGFQNPLKNSSVQFSSPHIKQNTVKNNFFYSRIKIGGLMYKRVTLWHIRNKLHSISTKVIPSHTFVNAFADFNSRIKILIFLESPQSWLLKIVQTHFLRFLGSLEFAKTKGWIKLVGTSILIISNMVFSLHFCHWLFKF